METSPAVSGLSEIRYSFFFFLFNHFCFFFFFHGLFNLFLCLLLLCKVTRSLYVVKFKSPWENVHRQYIRTILTRKPDGPPAAYRAYDATSEHPNMASERFDVRRLSDCHVCDFPTTTVRQNIPV